MIQILLLLLNIHFANAVECQAPAVAKKVEGENNTLHSWCEVNGVKEGPFETFSVEQGLQTKAQYHNGQLDGPFYRYWPGGKVATQGNYTQDQMSGTWIRYWDNGEKRDEGNWEKDRPVGKWKYYREDGSLERLVLYDSDGNKVKGKKINAKARSDNKWNFRLGFAHAQVERGSNEGERGTNGVGGGVDLRLFSGRWLRGELETRVLPEYWPKKEHQVYSGQVGFGLDVFPAWLDPFAITLRLGAHASAFDKVKAYGGFGFRYHFSDHFGVFFEASGFKYPADEANNYFFDYQGNYQRADYKRDSNIVLLGLMFAL